MFADEQGIFMLIIVTSANVRPNAKQKKRLESPKAVAVFTTFLLRYRVSKNPGRDDAGPHGGADFWSNAVAIVNLSSYPELRLRRVEIFEPTQLIIARVNVRSGLKE